MEDEKKIEIMSSKSVAQRAMICSFLGGGKVENIKVHEPCEDVLIFKNALNNIRDYIEKRPLSQGKREEVLKIDVGESGAALRFFLPLLGTLGLKSSIKIGKGLVKRPVEDLVRTLASKGQRIEAHNSGELIEVQGKLKGGVYAVPGNVSSQYVSGLLMVLPYLEKGSRIQVDGECESLPYIDLTLKVMRDFGVEIERYSEDGMLIYEMRGIGGYEVQGEYPVEGDWSSGSLFLAMSALSQREIRIYGLDLNSSQGDSAFASLMAKFGFNPVRGEDMFNRTFLTVEKIEAFHAEREISIDCRNIPDLVPVLSLMALCTTVKCTFYNINRLRYKESDRVSSIKDIIGKLGGRFSLKDNAFTVCGSSPLKGGVFEGFADHRMVMMQAAASICAVDKVVIRGADSVKKSYPKFFEHMRELGLNGNLETDYI